MSQEDYDDGYNEGHTDGLDEGHSEGYDEGYDEGKENGYEEGKEEIRNYVLELLDSMSDPDEIYEIISKIESY